MLAASIAVADNQGATAELQVAQETNAARNLLSGDRNCACATKMDAMTKKAKSAINSMKCKDVTGGVGDGTWYEYRQRCTAYGADCTTLTGSLLTGSQTSNNL